MGGSRRNKWRKRQRESRSEWHMAFSLKKDEQHENQNLYWLDKEEEGDMGRREENMYVSSAPKMVQMHPRFMLINVL